MDNEIDPFQRAILVFEAKELRELIEIFWDVYIPPTPLTVLRTRCIALLADNEIRDKVEDEICPLYAKVTVDLGSPKVKTFPNVEFVASLLYQNAVKLVEATLLEDHNSESSKTHVNYRILVTDEDVLKLPPEPYHILLRFSTLTDADLEVNTPKILKKDLFPSRISLKVNGSIIKEAATGCSSSLDVGEHIVLKPSHEHTISVSWENEDENQKFVMAVYVVQIRAATELVQKITWVPEVHTKEMIANLLTTMNGDGDLLQPECLKVSLTCPLGTKRMIFPCRANTCCHLQCFDALEFVKLNERKPGLVCPVCRRDFQFNELHLDTYFFEIVRNPASQAGNKIMILADGSWNLLSRDVKDLPSNDEQVRSVDSD